MLWNLMWSVSLWINLVCSVLVFHIQFLSLCRFRKCRSKQEFWAFVEKTKKEGGKFQGRRIHHSHCKYCETVCVKILLRCHRESQKNYPDVEMETETLRTISRMSHECFRFLVSVTFFFFFFFFWCVSRPTVISISKITQW